jgi:hypothetical protein
LGQREKEIEHESEHSYIKIQKDNIKGVYREKSVVCFEIENYEVKTGDYIIVKSCDGHFSKRKILNIKKDDKSYETLKITEKENIGVKLENDLNKNQSFFVKKI